MADISLENNSMNIDLVKVQNRLVEIACIIEDILNNHDIPHSIMNGTLIGAIRDGGFIPWDDDFDFVVFNEYYDQALQSLREDLPEWLFLEYKDTEPNFYHAWARVKDLNSVVECGHYLQDNSYSHHGLAVDLFRIEKLPLKDLCTRSENEYINYIKRRYDLGSMNFEEVKNRLGKLLEITEYFWTFRMKNEDEKSINREVLASLYTGRNYYEIDDFFPLKNYVFGNASFLGPNKGEAVLTKCYGDFMSLPPVEERIPHYSKVEFLD